MPHHVVAVAYDGLCLFEFGIAAEVFGLDRPELDVAWYRFTVVAAGARPLRAEGGIVLAAPGDLSQIETAGTVVVPGWRDPGERPPGALLAALRRAHRNGARMVSICSGVFVLAAAGLLDGRRVTTHWRYAERLARAHPAVRVDPDVLYVDDGDVLTSAGSAAGIDLCLHIVRQDFGADVANRVARRLVVPPHRDGGQAQYVVAPVPVDGRASLAGVMDWARARLDQRLTVADLAREAAMAPRTFARRFRGETGTTPYRWLVEQRLHAAQRLLETGDDTVDRIARTTGFTDAMTLRHHFRAAFATTPTAYRRRFTTVAAGARPGTADRAADPRPAPGA